MFLRLWFGLVMRPSVCISASVARLTWLLAYGVDAMSVRSVSLAVRRLWTEVRKQFPEVPAQLGEHTGRVDRGEFIAVPSNSIRGRVQHQI